MNNDYTVWQNSNGASFWIDKDRNSNYSKFYKLDPWLFILSITDDNVFSSSRDLRTGNYVVLFRVEFEFLWDFYLYGLFNFMDRNLCLVVYVGS